MTRNSYAIVSLVKATETTVPPLDKVLAEAVGILCGQRQVSDVIDASAILVARREGPRTVIVTSDIDDLQRFDKSIELHRI